MRLLWCFLFHAHHWAVLKTYADETEYWCRKCNQLRWK